MPGGMYFYGKLDDVFPFGFGSNDTSGSGDDGATPTAKVARDGAADNAAPVHEPTPALLSHANFDSGSYRLLITASTGNGYANGESYLVYCSLAVDAQNPTGFLGGFSLSATGKVFDNTSRYDGGIWIDSGAANANTVVGVDGIPSNPVSTLVAARTIADAIGVKKYFITNGSALTLAATHQWWDFVGIGRAGNIINLGSQDIDNSSFCNLSMAGTQGGSTFIKLEKCYLTSLLSLRPQAFQCVIAGNITILTGTMLSFDSSRSGVPGETTPIITYSAGATTLQFRDYSGGGQFNNMTSDHTMSFEGNGQIIFDVSCTGGSASLRGNMSITDNSGNVTITKDAVYNKSEVLDAIVDDSTQFSGADIASILANTQGLTFKKNTAYNNFSFTMRDSNGDPLTGEAVTGQVSLDGGNFANLTNAVSEIQTSGVYNVNLANTDLNGDAGILVFTSNNTKARGFIFATVT